MILAFVCVAAAVIDGDTLACATAIDGVSRVRLARIDAPETRGCRPGRQCAPGSGKAARSYLRGLAGGRDLACERIDASPGRAGFQALDPYRRIVATCRTYGIDLGDAMLRAGMAVTWPR